MTILTVSGRPVQTVFDLLGRSEKLPVERDLRLLREAESSDDPVSVLLARQAQ